ncbi:hypothetical protein [Demequina lignilytica]|uniref:DUF2568 domain-containing protein n=1 Tax=Demequina lignilytica TaxID=3051663 RepID=A0AB35MJU2_9MICO|nr:hypothetical protein [Demequina sp. SYSU T0a273]MDN4484022.1 hypothetical protein [Demequina sp. SYSU T0a273]
MNTHGRLLRVLSQISGLAALGWWLETLAGVGLPIRLASLAAIVVGSVWMRYRVRWVIEREGLAMCVSVCAMLGAVGSFAYMATGLWIGALAHLILVVTAVRVTLEEFGVTRALA